MAKKSGCATVLLILVIAVAALWLLREPLLRAAGSILISEDELEQSEVIFVLSGGSWDRGNEAVRLYHKGYAPLIICTGANIPPDFQSLGIMKPESEITQINIINQGVPDSVVQVIRQGTSTFEESEIILEYCKRYNIGQCIVVSSLFHTRRINMVFKEKFRDEQIKYMLHGAPSSSYAEMEWWESEGGLIAVNNEYIKLGYYLWKYNN